MPRDSGEHNSKVASLCSAREKTDGTGDEMAAKTIIPISS